jgi:heptosyltransferase-1
MPLILLVKTSSLGDVVHNLPVVSDLCRTIPGVEIDWAVEESLAAIPGLHPALRQVVPVALRRWRKSLWRGQTRDEIRAFLRELRQREYDAVIDTQGLLKSALLTRAARGRRYGLDWKSAREPLGAFYDQTFHVSWTQHAVERNRSLAAQALRYDLTDAVDYGISTAPREFSWLQAKSWTILLHATSADRKLWREADWVSLGRHFANQGICCVLPWGNVVERARSETLAAQIAGAIVAPALGLEEVAALLAGAHAVVGLDTGLTHLAAALDVPTVGIYCATDPSATGLYACRRAANLGGIGKAPAVSAVTAALERLLAINRDIPSSLNDRLSARSRDIPSPLKGEG